MKIYNKLILVASLFFIAISCSDDDSEALASNEKGGVIATITDVTGGIYIEGEGTSLSGFTVSEASGEFVTYDILIQLNDDGNTLAVASSANSSIPSTFEYTLSQVASVLDVPLTTLEVGDLVHFLVRFNGVEGVESSTSEALVTIPVSCPSDLAGTFDYVSTSLSAGDGAPGCSGDPVTGQVTWAAVGGGNYTTTDLGFGQFGDCWDDSPATSSSARINDVCGKITVLGSDQYGDTYSYTIDEIDNLDLYITWSNSFGDGGKVVLTRTDGNNWPEDLR